MKYFLWALFIILNPFYLFKAGLPQISDYLLVTLILGNIPILKLGIKNSFFSKKWLYMFLGYVFLVNFILWMAYFTTYRGIPLITTVFYFYNAVVMFFVIGLAQFNFKKFLKYTSFGLAATVLIQVGYYILFGSVNLDHFRPAFFFQTPNQLGYFALLIITIFILINKFKKVNTVVFVLVFLSCLFMTLLSASKAATGGALFLCVLYLFDSQVLKGYGLISVVAIVICSYIFLFKNETGVQRASYILQRVEDGAKEKEITEWEYRGYDRITNHPYYIILGSGEGMYMRFNSYIKKHEMHSSIGTLLFSYGLPGLLFFSAFFSSLFKGLKIKIVLYIVPVVLYSLTHMGLRFTPLWILFAMFPIIKMVRYLYKQQLKQQLTLDEPL